MNNTQTARRGLIPLLIASLASQVCLAFPIRKPTQAELIAASELIALVRVEEVGRLTGNCELYCDTARLRVLRTLRGKAAVDDRVTAVFENHMVCPRPPKFEPGEEQVVFVRPPDERGQREITCLTFGQIRSASTADADLVASIIAGHERVIAEPDVEARKRLQIEWMLSRLENPSTRDDALYDLSQCARPTIFEAITAVLVKLEPACDPARDRPPGVDMAIELATDLSDEQQAKLRQAIRRGLQNERTRYDAEELQRKLTDSEQRSRQKTPAPDVQPAPASRPARS